MNQAAITLEDVSFRYSGGPLILDKVNLSVAPGEFVGVVGPNGSGKSTLLRIILGLLTPNSGRVAIFDRAVESSRNRIGYVPQYLDFNVDFPISAKEVVLMGCMVGLRLFSRYSPEQHRLVDEQMQRLQIKDLGGVPFGKLSGGQQQRVLIARAMVSDPDILILDEPTASADPGAEQNIFHLLGNAAKSKAILLVSHDVGFISSFVKRVACLNRTLVCHDTAHLTPELMDQLYGHHVHAIDHQH